MLIQSAGEIKIKRYLYIYMYSFDSCYSANTAVFGRQLSKYLAKTSHVVVIVIQRQLLRDHLVPKSWLPQPQSQLLHIYLFF